MHDRQACGRLARHRRAAGGRRRRVHSHARRADDGDRRGVPVTVIVHVRPTLPAGAVSIRATWAGHSRHLAAAKAGAAFRARVDLPSAPARWTLTAHVADKALASRGITSSSPLCATRVVVDPRGRVYRLGWRSKTVVLVSPGQEDAVVHATGFDEPVGLAATRTRSTWPTSRRSRPPRRRRRRVTTLARLPQVTAVAVSPSGTVYAVTMDRHRSPASRPRDGSRRSRSRAGLTVRTGSRFDRAGDILVAEDSRRVRRDRSRDWRRGARGRRRRHELDRGRPRTGRCSSPARSPTGGSLARPEPRRDADDSCSRASTSAMSRSFRASDLIVTAVRAGRRLPRRRTHRSPRRSLRG